MSKETLAHLNTHTLIGNTDHRGTAWHYRAEHQGAEPNHYPGPIPVDDVRRRLFHWQAVSRPVAVQTPTSVENASHLNDADNAPAAWTVIPGRQAICRDDTGHVMGLFADGYTMHQYSEWLLTTVANLLDDDLSISSAGLLRHGAVAWVEVSVPQSITTPQGVEFRPNLLATTSFDGSVATTYKRTVTDVVCDNTREAALAEHGQAYKVRHSRHSTARLAPAREALAMVHSIADDFAAEVARLCATPVDDRQWNAFLAALVPLPADTSGAPAKNRKAAMADRKREQLTELYRHDARVAPWTGTAHGVLQAVNTWEHHASTVRGGSRGERNMLRTITGEWDRIDRSARQTLQQVLA
jgi:phage/plasmid-like protein (TIGR03299 family)